MNGCMRRGECSPSADLRDRQGGSTKESRESLGHPGGRRRARWRPLLWGFGW